MNIEELAQQKSFAQLSPAERAEVLEEMSQEDYGQLHLTISTLRRMDADARPSPMLREKLLQQMIERDRTPRTRWYRQPVPVWLAAALALLVGVATACYFSSIKKQRPAEPPVVIQTEVKVQHDTVWLTKTVYRERVVYRDREPQAAPPPVPAQASVRFWVPPTVPDSVLAAQFTIPTAPAGTPVSAWPELMQFLGSESKR